MPGLPAPISEILVIGRRMRRVRLDSGPQPIEPDRSSALEIFDRQVRAFGQEGQALVMQAKVAIVGIGGTGSATAEQLVRLGTEDLVLIDPDAFQPSNRTRVYGTFASSSARRWWPFREGLPRKAHLVAAHLRKINPRAKITPIAKNVVLQDAALALLERDAIFLCTDDHWGRSIVNEIAYQYFVPTINLGVRIAAEDGKISSGVGTVDVLRPDLPCLWCSEFLRAERIAAESISRRRWQALEAEGYVEGLDTPAPSVVSMTTATSGLAVTLFLQLLTDFMGAAGDIARLNWDVMAGTVRRGRAAIQNPCVCSKLRAFGDLRPLSTVTDLTFLEE